MMDLILRLLIYAVVLFLIMLVYTGQHYDNAKETLHQAAFKTGKFVGWTAVLILIMNLCFWMFID